MKIGSLFSGYQGLDLAVEAVTGAHTVWVSDIDKGACKILAHRAPDIPNRGDITAIDWSAVEPVDILTGGFPCQDLSHAGKRAGLKEGTRSGLWSHMARAIDELRPRLVVAENVRGLLSAEAPGEVEPCPWCVGDGSTVDLRALGVVLADLAGLGYDAQWIGLRAADVGACHGRFRVFLAAYPRDTDNGKQGPLGGLSAGTAAESSGVRGKPAQDADCAVGGEWWLTAPSQAPGGRSRADAGRPNREGTDGVTLLPTPAVNDMGAGKSVEAWDEWTDAMKAKHGNGNGHGKSLEIEAARLLPTPMAAEGTKPSNTMGVARRRETGEVFLTNVIVSLEGLDPTENRLMPTPSVADVQGGRKARSGDRSDEQLFNGLAADQRFGDYAAAIARWETVIGRPVPNPTEPTGRDNAHRLSPRFVEWMMGLPEGWVTDVPGLTRNEALKALGNGVVPLQAEVALRHMLTMAVAA